MKAKLKRTPPKGPKAARLRKKKFDLLRDQQALAIPEDGLPGSLTLKHTKCGNPNCHCARGKGHPGWALSFRAGGRARTVRIQPEWVEEVRRQVEAGRAYREAVNEVFVANAELLVLERQQRTKRKRR